MSQWCEGKGYIPAGGSARQQTYDASLVDPNRNCAVRHLKPIHRHAAPYCTATELLYCDQTTVLRPHYCTATATALLYCDRTSVLRPHYCTATALYCDWTCTATALYCDWTCTVTAL